MTAPEPGGVEAEVAAVLAAHDWFTPRGYAWPCCSCGTEFPSNDEADIFAHVAAALASADLLRTEAAPDGDLRAAVEALATQVVPRYLAEHSCFKPWCPNCAQRKQAESIQRTLRAVLDQHPAATGEQS